MIFRRLLAPVVILILFGFSNCKSVPDSVNAETSFSSNEFFRIDINESRGNFFLYYLSDARRMHYEQLFNSRNLPGSYTSISVDGKVFRLGDSHFPAVLEWLNGNPVLKFEYHGIIVTQVFSLVRTDSSAVNNGVMITYTIYNFMNQDSSVGLTVLIDTTLGEEKNKTPFIIHSDDSSGETRSVTTETLIEGETGSRYWVSRGSNAALIGSIIDPLDSEAKAPDFIHFANWKRLHNSKGRLNYSQGRALGSDSAVSYIYEPVLIESGNVISYRIFLTTDDADWGISVEEPQDQTHEPELQMEQEYVTAAAPIAEEPPAPAIPVMPAVKFDLAAMEEEILAAAIENNEHAEVQILIRLHDILVQFVKGEIDLSEQDLLDIERAIERLKF